MPAKWRFRIFRGFEKPARVRVAHKPWRAGQALTTSIPSARATFAIDRSNVSRVQPVRCTIAICSASGVRSGKSRRRKRSGAGNVAAADFDQCGVAGAPDIEIGERYPRFAGAEIARADAARARAMRRAVIGWIATLR
jgi:hypothetical protein